MIEFKKSVFSVSGGQATFGDNSGNTTVSNVKITNNVRSSGGKEPESGDGIGVMTGVFGAAVLVAWFYLRHFGDIHLLLRCGYLASLAPVLIAVATSAGRSRDDTSTVALSGLPVGAIAGAAFMLIAYIEGQVSPEILALAQHTNPVQMWQGLTEFGRRVVLENEGSAMFVVIALVINMLTAIHVLASRTISPLNLVSRLTARYTPVFGTSAGALFLAFGWALSSGQAYDWWAAMQASMAH